MNNRLLSSRTVHRSASRRFVSEVRHRLRAALFPNTFMHRRYLTTLNIELLEERLTLTNDVGFPGFPAQAYQVDAGPRDVVTGDFNGDLIRDIATAHAGNVSIRLGAGDGTLGPKERVSLQISSVQSLAVADTDLDGHQDIILVGDQASIEILVGVGDGSFDGNVILSVPYSHESSITSIVAEDLNDDGLVDLVVSRSNHVNLEHNDIHILLNQGENSFENRGSHRVGLSPKRIAIDDFDSDGFLDIATANHDSGNVSLLYGRGEGRFSEPQEIPAGRGPMTIAVADINADGWSDLVVANSASADLTLLYGSSLRGFDQSVSIPVGVSVTGIAKGYFDGDEIVDLALTSLGGDVLVFTELSEEVSQPQSRFPTIKDGIAILADDFNSDGIADLVSAHHNSNGESSDTGFVAIHLGTVGGAFSNRSDYQVAAELTQTAGNPSNLLAVDLNDDGVLDLVTTNESENHAAILYGRGDGSFDEPQLYPTDVGPRSLATGDFNGDGRRDLVTANITSDTVSVFIATEFGRLDEASNYAVGGAPWHVVAVDLNQDGLDDIFTANHADNTISFLEAKTSGSFSLPVDYASGDSPSFISPGDFNKDGVPDLVVANSGSDDATVLMGSSSGGLSVSQTFSVGDGPIGIAKTSVNDDSYLDLAILNSGGTSDQHIAIFTGASDGTFSFSSNPGVDWQGVPSSIVAGDLNQDGNEDLAIGPYDGAGQILFGNGAGGFLSPQIFWSGSRAASLAIGDTNRDGRSDLIATSADQGQVAVLTNLGQGKFSGGLPGDLISGDFTNDGIVDLIVPLRVQPGLAVMVGLESGGFQTHQISDLPTANSNVFEGIDTADFNIDGNLDLIIGQGRYSPSLVLLGNGHGKFPDVIHGPYFTSAAIGDFSGDGIPDISFANKTDTFFYSQTHLGLGDGDFEYFGESGSVAQGFRVVGDFNNDGKNDFASLGLVGSLSVSIGNGHGGFTTSNAGSFANAKELVVDDFDGDGILDLAVSILNSSFHVPSEISVLIGQGDGRFHPDNTIRFDNNAIFQGRGIALTSGDVNNDSLPDLIASSLSLYGSNGSTVVLINLGGGDFSAPQTFGVGKMRSAEEDVGIVSEDFNKDGFADIAVVNSLSNDVTIQYGRDLLGISPIRVTSGPTGFLEKLQYDFTIYSPLPENAEFEIALYGSSDNTLSVDDSLLDVITVSHDSVVSGDVILLNEDASELFDIGHHSLLVSSDSAAFISAMEDSDTKSIFARIASVEGKPGTVLGTGVNEFRGIFQSGPGATAVVRTGAMHAADISVAANGRLQLQSHAALTTDPAEILVIGSNFDDRIRINTSDSAFSVPLRVFAGDGNDQIEAGGGFDYLDGGKGNDRFIFGVHATGDKLFVDPEGIDTLDFSRLAHGVQVDLEEGEINSPQDPELKILSGENSLIENIIGSSFADRISGNALSNRIDGREGGDLLYGDSGDRIIGGDDDDQLFLESLDIRQISGRAGRDSIILNLDRETLDLGELDNISFIETEVLALDRGKVSKLIARPEDIERISGDGVPLFVERFNEQVVLDGEWQFQGRTSQYSKSYIDLISTDANLLLQVPDIEGVNFSFADISVDEGRDVLFEATLQEAADEDIVIPIFAPFPSFTEDFAFLHQNVLIEAGQLSGSATISTHDDALDEWDETFSFISIDGKHTVTIVDNDPPPQVSFYSGGQRVEESAGIVTISAFLSVPSGRDVFVPLTIAGSALAGEDYELPQEGVIEIRAERLFSSIDIIIINDSLGERSEKVLFELESSELATPSNLPGAVLEHAIVISASDTPELNFEFANVELSEGVGQFVIKATLSNPSAHRISMKSPTTVGSTASNSDYSIDSTDFTFEPGQVVSEQVLYILDDKQSATINPAEISLVRQSAMESPLNNESVESQSAPELVDLDSDGDTDLVVGSSDGSLYYWENIGTPSAPIFVERSGAGNPLPKISAHAFDSVPEFVDLDNDGDQDLIVGYTTGPDGGRGGRLTYFENVGIVGQPSFEERIEYAGSMGLPKYNFWTEAKLSPSLADIDNDGDYDLVVGRLSDIYYDGETGYLSFFENVGGPETPSFVISDSLPGVSWSGGQWSAPSASKPAFGDLDDDGDIDLLVGGLDGRFHYLENVGTSENPNFVESFGSSNPLYGQLVDSYANPAFGDLDGDGDLDLVAGGGNGMFSVFTTTLGERGGIVEELYRETVVFDMLPVSDALFGQTRRLVVEIVDNDTPTVSLEINDVWEDAGSAMLSAKLDLPATNDVEVTIFISRTGTDESDLDQDLESTSSSIFIPAGATEANTTIWVHDNSNYESNERFLVSQVKLWNAIAGEAAEFAILDDDPIVSIRPTGTRQRSTDLSLVEGETVTYEINVEGSHNESITIAHEIDRGTTEGSDYEITYLASKNAAGKFVVPASAETYERIGLFTLKAIRDGRLEKAERMAFEYSADALILDDWGASVAVGYQYLKIEDNTPATIGLQFDNGTNRASVSEKSGLVNYSVKLSGGVVDFPVTFKVHITPDSTAGATDFNFLEAELVIPAGESMATGSIQVYEDLVREGPEKIRFFLSTEDLRPSGGNGQLVLPYADLRILDATILNDSAIIDSSLIIDLDEGVLTPDNAELPKIGRKDLAFSGINGLIIGGSAFFDANFNGVRDFVDSNSNGIHDTGELEEPGVETSTNGSFRLEISDGFDQSGDGLVDEYDGQLVVVGGINSSTGLPLRAPMSAPGGYYAITPVSTVVRALMADHFLDVTTAEKRILAAFGVAHRSLAQMHPFVSHLDRNQLGSQLVILNASIQNTVVQVSSLISGLPDSVSFEFAADQLYRELAAKASHIGAKLNLSSKDVVKSILDGISVRTASNLSDASVSAAAQIIAEGNQILADLDALDKIGFLRNAARIQAIAQGEISTALSELASGGLSVEEAIEQFTGIGLRTKLQTASIVNVLPVGIVVNDIRGIESNGTTTTFSFTVSLTRPPQLPVSVEFATQDQIAKASNSDYHPSSGTLFWEIGDTESKTVEVLVGGDTDFEVDEQFLLVLSSATNAVLVKDIGYATIVNDDALNFHLGDSDEPNLVSLAFENDYFQMTVNQDVIYSGTLSAFAPILVVGDQSTQNEFEIVIAGSSPVVDRQVEVRGGTPGDFARVVEYVEGISETEHEIGVGSLLIGNQPPFVEDDNAFGHKNNPIAIDVLGNDTDETGEIDVSTVEVIVDPTAGTTSVLENGEVMFTPPDNFVGTVTFSYIVSDNFRASSDAASVTVTIRNSLWQNPQEVHDVNSDSFVSPIDVLLLVNYLNSNRENYLPNSGISPIPFLDPSGDEFVSPLDVLIVINYLNQNAGGEGEYSDNFACPPWRTLHHFERCSALTANPQVAIFQGSKSPPRIEELRHGNAKLIVDYFYRRPIDCFYSEPVSDNIDLSDLTDQIAIDGRVFANIIRFTSLDVDSKL